MSGEHDMTHESKKHFVEGWLQEAKEKRPNSKIQKLIEESTKEQELNETALLDGLINLSEDQCEGDDDVPH